MLFVGDRSEGIDFSSRILTDQQKDHRKHRDNQLNGRENDPKVFVIRVADFYADEVVPSARVIHHRR